MKSQKTIFIQKRKKQYILLLVGLSFVFFLIRPINWVGNQDVHTLMEIVATLLSFFVGILAIVRFYSQKINSILFVGVGFLGTSLLDGYHALATSRFFDALFPSPPPSLAPWSWVASRFYLSVLIFASWLVWNNDNQSDHKITINETLVYTWASLFTLACFVFFIFYPLPRAYYPELLFGRPEEFVPALFFLLALVGYLLKGHWKNKNDHFDHWMVITLIVSFISQTVFMSFSFKLFDTMYDAAHMLKKISYICALTGLLISMYYLFRKVEDGAHQVENSLKLEERSRLQTEAVLKESEESKRKLQEQTEELQRMNRLMVDRELRMIELKKENAELKKKGKEDG